MGMPSTRLRLRVVPGSTRPGIVGRHGEAWKVRVAEAPERGRANDAVLDLVAEALSLPLRDVSLVAGHASRDKIVEVDGIGEDEMRCRLENGAR
jgi:uncharacterized protein YggU (UPF0235/DUF167 family)